MNRQERLDYIKDQYFNQFRTMQDIGDEFGISRERVRQLLHSMGLRGDSVALMAHRKAALTEQYGQQVHNSFDELRNVTAVVQRFVNVVPASLVREILGPRSNETICSHPSIQKYTDEQMISFLQEAASCLGVVLTSDLYNQWRSSRIDAIPMPGALGIQKRFGSWRIALAAAGLPSNTPIRKQYSSKFTPEQCYEVMASFVQYALSNDQRPKAKLYEIWCLGRKDVPSLSTLRKTTGMQWTDLLRHTFNQLKTTTV
jgi:sulfur carrier protein ThiS